MQIVISVSSRWSISRFASIGFACDPRRPADTFSLWDLNNSSLLFLHNPRHTGSFWPGPCCRRSTLQNYFLKLSNSNISGSNWPSVSTKLNNFHSLVFQDFFLFVCAILLTPLNCTHLGEIPSVRDCRPFPANFSYAFPQPEEIRESAFHGVEYNPRGMIFFHCPSLRAR